MPFDRYLCRNETSREYLYGFLLRLPRFVLTCSLGSHEASLERIPFNPSACTSVILANMWMAWTHLRVTFLGVIFLIGSLPVIGHTLDPMALYLPDQSQTDQSVIIPDGTQIELRFAQDVWGQAVKKSALPVQVAGQVQPGDTVSLVSVADVRIG